MTHSYWHTKIKWSTVPAKALEVTSDWYSPLPKFKSSPFLGEEENTYFWFLSLAGGKVLGWMLRGIYLRGFQGVPLDAGMEFLLQKVMRYVARDIEWFGEQHYIKVYPRWSSEETLRKESFRGEEQDHGAKPDMVMVPGASSSRRLYGSGNHMHRTVKIIMC